MRAGRESVIAKRREFGTGIIVHMRMNRTRTKPASARGRGGVPASAPRLRSAANRAEAVAFLLYGVAKGWREQLDRRLRPLGLTRAQWQALLFVSRMGGVLSQRELADALEIGAPATVALLDRMERDGLVARIAVPDDRRRKAVRLTAESRRLLTRIEATAGSLRQDILNGLTAREVRTLQTLLGKARKRIDALKA